MSNRLNVAVEGLTVMSTIFLPPTVLTGIRGMTVPLPALPGGGAARFWWVLGIRACVAALMLAAAFRRMRWI